MNKLDKKTLSQGLIILSVISAALAGFDFLSVNFAPLGLGADSWVGITAILGIWAIYVKSA